MLVFGFEIGIEASGDERWHVEGMPDVGASAANEALAFPLAGLSRERSKASERCSLVDVTPWFSVTDRLRPPAGR